MEFKAGDVVDIPLLLFSQAGDDGFDAPSFLSVGNEPGALFKERDGQVDLTDAARLVRVEPLPRNGLVDAGVEVRERLYEIRQTAVCIPAKPTTRFGHSDRSEAT
jgi:hypothetical protein